MQVEVLKIDGAKTGRKIELPDDILALNLISMSFILP